MDVLGWPAAQWAAMGDLVEVMLQAFNPMLPLDQRTPSYAAAGQIMQMLQAGLAPPAQPPAQPSTQCPAHAAAQPPVNPAGLACRIEGLSGAGILSQPEAMGTMLDFLLGGYLSSVFLTSTAIHNLLKQPAAFAAYQKGDAALRANAFEEMKRFDAPFQLADRYAAKDITLGGVFIPKDSLVSLALGSANHDPAVYGSTSEQFDIERAANAAQNLVFGTGEHRCIGAPMAGQAVPIVIDTLVDQCANLALIPGMSVGRGDPYFRGFSQLLLRR
jgi:cytochrome P450